MYDLYLFTQSDLFGAQKLFNFLALSYLSISLPEGLQISLL